MKNLQATSRTIHLQGDVEDCMAEALAIQLAYLGSLNRKPVIVQINSYGGCLTDGLAIIDLISASRAPVYVVATGAAYSAAALILALGPEGRRAATKNTSIMFHATKAGTDSELLKNVQGYTKFLRDQERKLDKAVCSRTSYAFKTFRSLMDSGGEIWLTAEQAKKKRVIDEIWTPEISAAVYSEIRGKK